MGFRLAVHACSSPEEGWWWIGCWHRHLSWVFESERFQRPKGCHSRSAVEVNPWTKCCPWLLCSDGKAWGCRQGARLWPDLIGTYSRSSASRSAYCGGDAVLPGRVQSQPLSYRFGCGLGSVFRRYDLCPSSLQTSLWSASSLASLSYSVFASSFLVPPLWLAYLPPHPHLASCLTVWMGIPDLSLHRGSLLCFRISTLSMRLSGLRQSSSQAL